MRRSVTSVQLRGKRENGMYDSRSAQPGAGLPPYANYAHAVEVPVGARLLFISGLNGYESDGVSMPTDFEGQANRIWDHLTNTLKSAQMGIEDLVSLRFYLADAGHDPANVATLKTRLGQHHCARTVICAGMLEPGWLIEVEAIAAKS